MTTIILIFLPHHSIFLFGCFTSTVKKSKKKMLLNPVELHQDDALKVLLVAVF